MKFQVTCSPSSTWKINVVVWPTHKRLIEERQKLDRVCNEPLAFFHDYTSNRKLRTENWKDSIIGTCHFYKGDGLLLRLIIHECTHAAVAFAYQCRFSIYDYRSGEEEFVKSVEHMSTLVWAEIKKRK